MAKPVLLQRYSDHPDSGRCWQASSAKFLDADDLVDADAAMLTECESEPKPSVSQGFSIRRYVSTVRSNDIRKSWPFCQKYLQLFLDNGRVPFLPPLENPASAQYSTENKAYAEPCFHGSVAGGPYDAESAEITSTSTGSEQVKKPNSCVRSGTIGADKTSEFKTEGQLEPLADTNTPQTCYSETQGEDSLHIEPPSKRRLAKQTPETGGNKAVKKTPAKGDHKLQKENKYEDTKKVGSNVTSSIVCPVCRIFSCASNTALNAHIDQCLSSTPEDVELEKEAPAREDAEICMVAKHPKPKTRKKRLITDIFATARMRTIETFDSTCFSEQHLESPHADSDRVAVQSFDVANKGWMALDVKRRPRTPRSVTGSGQRTDRFPSRNSWWLSQSQFSSPFFSLPRFQFESALPSDADEVNFPSSEARCCDYRSLSSFMDKSKTVSSTSSKPDHNNKPPGTDTPEHGAEKDAKISTSSSSYMKCANEPCDISENRSPEVELGLDNANPLSVRKTKPKKKSRKRKLKKKLVSLNMIACVNSHREGYSENGSSFEVSKQQDIVVGTSENVVSSSGIDLVKSLPSKSNRRKRAQPIGDIEGHRANKRMRNLSTLSLQKQTLSTVSAGKNVQSSFSDTTLTDSGKRRNKLEESGLVTGKDLSTKTKSVPLSNTMDTCNSLQRNVQFSKDCRQDRIRRLLRERSFRSGSCFSKRPLRTSDVLSGNAQAATKMSRSRQCSGGRKFLKQRKKKNTAARKMKKVAHLVRDFKENEENSKLSHPKAFCDTESSKEAPNIIYDSGSNSNVSSLKMFRDFNMPTSQPVQATELSSFIGNRVTVDAHEMDKNGSESCRAHGHTGTVTESRDPLKSTAKVSSLSEASRPLNESDAVCGDEIGMSQHDTLDDTAIRLRSAASFSPEPPAKRPTCQQSLISDKQTDSNLQNRTGLDGSLQSGAESDMLGQKGSVPVDLSVFDSSYGSSITFETPKKSANSGSAICAGRERVIYTGTSKHYESPILISEGVRANRPLDDIPSTEKLFMSSDPPTERPSLIKLIEELPAIPQDFESLEKTSEGHFNQMLFTDTSFDPSAITQETLQRKSNPILGEDLLLVNQPLSSRAQMTSCSSTMDAFSQPVTANLEGKALGDDTHCSAMYSCVSEFRIQSKEPCKPKTSKTSFYSQDQRHLNKTSQNPLMETSRVRNHASFERQSLASLPLASDLHHHRDSSMCCNCDSQNFLESVAKQRCSLDNVNCASQSGVLHLFGNPILRLMGKNLIVSSKDDIHLAEMECRGTLDRDTSMGLSCVNSRHTIAESILAPDMDRPVLNATKCFITPHNSILQSSENSVLKKLHMMQPLKCDKGRDMISWNDDYMKEKPIIEANTLSNCDVNTSCPPCCSTNHANTYDQHCLGLKRKRPVTFSSQNGHCDLSHGRGRLSVCPPSKSELITIKNAFVTGPTSELKSLTTSLGITPQQSENFLLKSVYLAPNSTHCSGNALSQSSQNFDTPLNKAGAISCSPLLLNMEPLMDSRKLGADKYGIP